MSKEFIRDSFRDLGIQYRCQFNLRQFCKISTEGGLVLK